MRCKLSIAVGLWALTLALAACAPAALPPGATHTPALEVPTITPAPSQIADTQPPPETAPSIKNLPVVDLAVRDLAARLGVNAGEIEVRSLEETEWPDAGLGCPQPGSDYAQVITPGFRLVLAHGGESYPYHTDLAQAVVLCRDLPKEALPAPGKLETPAGVDPDRPDSILIFGPRARETSGGDYAAQVAAAVTEDLAARAGLEVDQVQVTAGEYTEVDLAAPCGTATGRSETGPIGDGLALGYEVILEAAGATHRYVASGGLAYYCGIP